MLDLNVKKRIENLLEVNTCIARLKHAIQSGTATINFQKDRLVDENRNIKFTNRYTISKLFPDEDEVSILKRELSNLAACDYIETIKDLRFPKRSDMRVFGRQYSGEDVFIKIRVELVSVAHASGGNYIFVMSFHFAEWKFKETDFPYRKN
jgi:hypothetical protein